MKTLLSIHWALIGSLWYFFNGLLHTFFVIKEHKAEYNRDLLRLLTDGLLLMFSGAILFVCWTMLSNKVQYGGLLGIIVAGFMLIYCLMIFPFLKSYVTMVISIIVIAVCVKAIYDFPKVS